MPTYDYYQQLYCLSAASNAVGEKCATEADLESTMDRTLAEFIPQLTGSWKVTWGPRVFKSNPIDASMGPDNAWYVAMDDTQKLCVIAVAGTAPSSKPGWHIDLDVNNVVDFEAWTQNWPSQGIQPAPVATNPTQGTAYASQGTCIGVYNILSNPSRLAANGTLLGDYISNVVEPTGYKTIFTGHSMGGAVGPSVALGLLNAKIGQVGNTFILPSAGASPGNEPLVQAFTAAFPPGSAANPVYAVLNTDFFNTLDIVPQAWAIDATSGRYMNNINNIYSNAGPTMKFLIAKTVSGYSNKAQNSGIQYEPLAGTSFTGSPITPVKSLDELKKEARLEHTTAYWTVIGIQAWVQQFSAKLSEHPGVGDLPVESFVIPDDKDVKDL